MKSNTILQRTLGLGSDNGFLIFVCSTNYGYLYNQLTMCSNVWDSFVAYDVTEMESDST